MRDIRGDLEDRASFLEEQINLAQAQFEKLIEQLKREHEVKVEDLQTELAAVTTLMEGEYRRLTSAAPVQEAEPPRRRPALQPETEPRRQASAPPAPEPEQHRPPVAEGEPHRRPAPEPDYQPHPAPQAEYQRRPAAPETEHYRRPAPMAAAPAPEQRRPAAPEAYRRPAPAPMASAPVASAPMASAPEAEHDRRPAPQVYRRPAPMASQPEPEQRRPAAPEGEPYRRPVPPPMASAPEAAQRRPANTGPQQPLAEFLIRKLGEFGTMTRDDLCRFAVQEGYFADGEIADRGVHATLMNVAKAGFIRQLPNGTFAPATVMDTIRLRRAI